MMEIRDQIIDIIKREFIGPDPINKPGMVQKNGEEILSSDPPRIRYIAGILFPQKSKQEENIPDESSQISDVPDDTPNHFEQDDNNSGGNSKREYLSDAEELLNLSNSYQQSAMSMTVSIRADDSISVLVSAGVYNTVKYKDTETGKDLVRYFRIPIQWSNNGQPIELPTGAEMVKKYPVICDAINTKLLFAIIYRPTKSGDSLYTFTLENTAVCNGSIKDEDCYFQVEFRVFSHKGFCTLPEKTRTNTTDQDYLSNCILYRNVKSYAIGHGCAAEWDVNSTTVKEISTSIFPTYEIKPIVPSVIEGVSLDMLSMSDYGNRDNIIKELSILCDKYEAWIKNLYVEAQSISDKGTAKKHIESCEQCLSRMRNGIALLQTDDEVFWAFQLMNRAMLLQQLHYNLPLQNWVVEKSSLVLENEVSKLPNITDRSSWYDGEHKVYGKWRPFQLAFVLINLKSMAYKTCSDRSLVDLIWFPTGGGKTEAYLGLSAYTIFIRRIKNKEDGGTAILMRYTLRLLTSQQYERASALICACETIRQEFPERLGKRRITIGLWVGQGTTPNSMSDAVKAYDELYNGKSDINPFVVLKCPWCGAQMGCVNKSGKLRETPGYKKIKQGTATKIVFQCNNSKCTFSHDGNELPLLVVDSEIYKEPPTLLLGTVDKFAMLPYIPEARSLFGIKKDKRETPPDLIIQDELHLISGPLGSMVGHYETMINELCSYQDSNITISPKIIASTATISRADEQCHALYGCRKEEVKQFPPFGLTAGDSFFAIEDKNSKGRKYVGILASGASSNATATIRLYASLLYAGKAINVEKESDRDGYWTNIGYFNSIRELGQTETWIKADIEEYLHVMYKRRYQDLDENYKKKRRYISNDIELTSRIRSDKIPASLQELGIKYPAREGEKKPVDICLATNMISVGVDVPRLGLMTVSGQPKTTSEYIQATSRVGRSKSAPGLVFTIYNSAKPRDKSHYEHFIPYHSKIYCNVEPTSVTPFSAPLRERALHAIIVGMIRLELGNLSEDKPKIPDDEIVEKVKSIIRARVQNVDPDELEATLSHIDSIFQEWKHWEPTKYHDFSLGIELPLMFPAGTKRNAEWGNERGFETPTSMRNVDASCEAGVLENGYISEDDE